MGTQERYSRRLREFAVIILDREGNSDRRLWNAAALEMAIQEDSFSVIDPQIPEAALRKILAAARTSSALSVAKKRLLLAVKTGHSQRQIASELRVSLVAVNHWLTRHSSMAKRKKIERLRTISAGH